MNKQRCCEEFFELREGSIFLQYFTNQTEFAEKQLKSVKRACLCPLWPL